MCAHFSSWSTYVWFHANIFSWSRSTTLKNHVHSLLNCKGKCFLKKCIAAQILLINNIMREHFNSCICISVSFFSQQYSIMQPAQMTPYFTLNPVRILPDEWSFDSQLDGVIDALIDCLNNQWHFKHFGRLSWSLFNNPIFHMAAFKKTFLRTQASCL